MRLLRLSLTLVSFIILLIIGLLALQRRQPHNLPRLVFSNGDGRDTGIFYSILPNGQDLIQLTDREGYFHAVSPDGYWLAYSSDIHSHDLYIIRVDGTNQRTLIEPFSTDYRYFDVVAWSADSQWIIYRSGINGALNLYRVRIDGTENQPITTETEYPVYHEATSPDNEWLIYSIGDESSYDLPSIKYYRIRTDGTDKQFLMHTERRTDSLYWSPDNQWIVMVVDSGGSLDDADVSVINTQDWSRIPIVTFPNIHSREIRIWSPASDYFFFDNQDTIYRLQAADRQLDTVMDFDRSSMMAIDSYYPEQNALLIVSYSNYGETAEFAHADGSHTLVSLPTYSHRGQIIERIMWSPDCDWVLIAYKYGFSYFLNNITDNDIQILDLNFGISSGNPSIPDFEWALDSNWIYYSIYEYDNYRESNLIRYRIANQHKEEITNLEGKEWFVTWGKHSENPLHPFHLLGISSALLLMAYLNSHRLKNI